MKFPTIATPIYEVKLFSQKEPVRFRPFLVKEQKLMLLATEEVEPAEVMKYVKQIIKNCLEDETIDVDELPLVDIELLFLNFRARSMGENINVFFKCKNQITDGEETKDCGMVIEAAVNLLEVPVVNSEDHTKLILSDDVGVKMKYPTFETIQKLTTVEEEDIYEENSEFRAIAMCIDFVFDSESVYYSKDATIEEMINFILSLPPEKYDIISKFFTSLPTIRQEIHKECQKCNFKHKFVLEGLSDFFI